MTGSASGEAKGARADGSCDETALKKELFSLPPCEIVTPNR